LTLDRFLAEGEDPKAEPDKDPTASKRAKNGGNQFLATVFNADLPEAQPPV
jgi:hypothetical protein